MQEGNIPIRMEKYEDFVLPPMGNTGVNYTYVQDTEGKQESSAFKMSSKRTSLTSKLEDITKKNRGTRNLSGMPNTRDSSKQRIKMRSTAGFAHLSVKHSDSLSPVKIYDKRFITPNVLSNIFKDNKDSFR